MNNIARSFAEWMEDNNYGVFEESLYIGGVPHDAPNLCFWILSGGGAPVTRNTTGEKQKNYIIHIYYRNLDGEDVYNTLQKLEEDLNRKGCIDIDPYITITVEATTFPADQDLDAADRTVGLLEVTVTVYQDN